MVLDLSEEPVRAWLIFLYHQHCRRTSASRCQGVARSCACTHTCHQHGARGKGQGAHRLDSPAGRDRQSIATALVFYTFVRPHGAVSLYIHTRLLFRKQGALATGGRGVQLPGLGIHYF